MGRRWRGNKVSKGDAFLLPTRKHSRLGALGRARFRHSLFSPLSHSLHPPPAALVLQARAVCFANRRKKVQISPAKTKRTPIGVLLFGGDGERIRNRNALHFFFPLENIVVCTRSQARFAYSLFSPDAESVRRVPSPPLCGGGGRE